MCKSKTSADSKGEAANESSSGLDSGGIGNAPAATDRASADDAKNPPPSGDDASERSVVASPDPLPSPPLPSAATPPPPAPRLRRRREKRDRQETWSEELFSFVANVDDTSLTKTTSSRRVIIKKKTRSKMTSKHADDAKSGGLDALIPSLLGIVVLAVGLMARMGFRGRATVAGIDLGTTNSVVCVQSQKLGAGVGRIVCIPDPATNSPVVPSVVSFLDNHHARSFRLTKEERERHKNWRGGAPHPVDVVVGRAAKGRIDGHPHHTLYHSKRVIGREIDHPSVASLRSEVDFDVVPDDRDASGTMAAFGVPYHLPPSSTTAAAVAETTAATAPPSAVLSPSQIGSYVIHHLMTLTRNHLGHDNVRSGVIAIPSSYGRRRFARYRRFTP